MTLIINFLINVALLRTPNASHLSQAFKISEKKLFASKKIFDRHLCHTLILLYYIIIKIFQVLDLWYAVMIKLKANKGVPENRREAFFVKNKSQEDALIIFFNITQKLSQFLWQIAFIFSTLLFPFLIWNENVCEEKKCLAWRATWEYKFWE